MDDFKKEMIDYMCYFDSGKVSKNMSQRRARRKSKQKLNKDFKKGNKYDEFNK